MTDEERTELIALLMWKTGWAESAFIKMTDKELRDEVERRVG